MKNAQHAHLARPHGEEARSAVSNHEAALSFETAASQSPQDKADLGLRWVSDLICLWCLCANRACRRARGCKRDPRDCVARYAPLVPEDVRFGAAVMHEGRHYGLSYDEVRKDAPAEVAAVEAWIARANAAARKRA